MSAHTCTKCGAYYPALRRAHILQRLSEVYETLKPASPDCVDAAKAYLAELVALEIEHLCPRCIEVRDQRPR